MGGGFSVFTAYLTALMPFVNNQLDRLAPLWDQMLQHRFLTQTRDGTIGHDTFATWMKQDYLFVEAAIPMMGVLIAKAPRAHREPLTQAVSALYDELELFRERGASVGVDLGDDAPSFTCHAYIQYLMATVYQAPYAEAFTVLYAAEKAYHESWKVVADGLDADSPWQPFVDNWAGDDFAAYVDFLEGALNELADAAGDAEWARMAEHFETTTRYEIAFWEMAVQGPTWPGVNSPSEVERSA